MLKALNTAATGMAAQESNVNNISNNIANVNTVGFKKSRTEFEDLLYQTVEEAGARSSATSQYSVGTQIGSGAKISATRKEHSQGDPMVTDNPYDLLLNGDGFFGIIDSKGQIKFTRDGAFTVDATGTVVTKNGHKLYPGFTVPSNTAYLNISENGNIEAQFKDNPEPQNLGQIPVFTFINPTGLRSEGKNLYGATTGSGDAIQNVPGENNAATVQQGMLEASNVNIMNEMTSLIKAQRAYEMNSKVMGVADQILQVTNNIK
ncbi:MAG: flagellar basal-body rod protein FlgG [Bacteriovoracaceae bacterium]|nr:flagellar basal-body rod protein FlgG [Bacteriovoracaceae bacterium]